MCSLDIIFLKNVIVFILENTSQNGTHLKKKKKKEELFLTSSFSHL